MSENQGQNKNNAQFNYKKLSELSRLEKESIKAHALNDIVQANMRQFIEDIPINANRDELKALLDNLFSEYSTLNFNYKTTTAFNKRIKRIEELQQILSDYIENPVHRQQFQMYHQQKIFTYKGFFDI